VIFGFENPGITGGEGSPFVLSPLLGGVLKGDTSFPSDEFSGAKLERATAAVSTGCGFVGIFGFPARFIGGGTGGADEAGRSIFRGSALGAATVFVGKRGFESSAGVESRLGILNGLVLLLLCAVGDGESSARCDFGREGRGA